MPWLSLIWKYRKWLAYGLAALAVALLAWRVAAWRDGYLKREAAVAALHKEKEAREADLRQYAQDVERSEQERAALQGDLDAIRARFDNLPIPAPKTLIRTVEVPRETQVTSCPEPRVSVDFVRVFNDAGKP